MSIETMTDEDVVVGEIVDYPTAIDPEDPRAALVGVSEYVVVDPSRLLEPGPTTEQPTLGKLFHESAQESVATSSSHNSSAVELPHMDGRFSTIDQTVASNGSSRYYGIDADGKKRAVSANSVLENYGHAGEYQGKNPEPEQAETDQKSSRRFAKFGRKILDSLNIKADYRSQAAIDRDNATREAAKAARSDKWRNVKRKLNADYRSQAAIDRDNATKQAAKEAKQEARNNSRIRKVGRWIAYHADTHYESQTTVSSENKAQSNDDKLVKKAQKQIADFDKYVDDFDRQEDSREKKEARRQKLDRVRVVSKKAGRVALRGLHYVTHKSLAEMSSDAKSSRAAEAARRADQAFLGASQTVAYAPSALKEARQYNKQAKARENNKLNNRRLAEAQEIRRTALENASANTNDEIDKKIARLGKQRRQLADKKIVAAQKNYKRATKRIN